MTINTNKQSPPPKLQHLLANDLAELVHIFKENVVVRHSPNPAGGCGGEKKKLSPKNIRPGPGTGPAQRKTKVTRSTLFDSK